jgi:carbon monoxide dehydrogenase subunit G
MEHEVFVPVPAERLREALADPVRVARAVPGLQQDVGAEPVTGRLKVRVGGHTITYRGSARLSAQDDGSYAVEGDATEARGTGAVKLALTLRVAEADGGSTLTFDGTASADGRVTELPTEAVASAVARLLNRFAGNLTATAEPKRGAQTARGADTAGPSATEATESPTVRGAESPAVEGAEGAESADVPDPAEAVPSAAQDADTTEPAVPLASEAAEEPSATGDSEAGPDADDTPVPADEPTASEAPDTPDEPAPPVGFTPDLPAEAAHARRTMIGRSAEEVDHAPPRGRYAPVPAPQTIAPHSALRWAAPAAALVVASAIVVGRVLRKRQ